jgi:hypothetical protein
MEEFESRLVASGHSKMRTSAVTLVREQKEIVCDGRD